MLLMKNVALVSMNFYKTHKKSNYLVLTKTIMTPNFIAVVYISKNQFFLNSAVDIP